MRISRNMPKSTTSSTETKLTDQANDPSKAAPLTEGSLWKAIWTMSWPLTLTTIAGSITSIVDIQVAGLLGSNAQAAVGLCEQIIFIFMVFILSVSVGTTAVVSRAAGSSQQEDMIGGTAQSLSLAVLIGLFLCALSFVVARLILPIFSSSAEMLAQGQMYLSIFSIFLIPYSVLAIINAAFRAVGDAKTPLMLIAVSTSICVVGDYLTVVHHWPVPELGIKGIALSAIVGNGAAAAFAIRRLSKSALHESLKQLWPFSWPTMKRIIRIGLPSAFHRLSWSMAIFTLFFILTHCQFPVQSIASWTIGGRLESIVFMPLMALSMAVSAIVGQNLGARRVRRAFQAGWHVAWIGVGMMLVLASVLFISAEPLAKLMSHDPTVISYTAGYLRINALSEPFLALGLILSGALQGAGDTRSPMWLSIFCNWIIRLPLAWLFALKLGWGPNGAWLAMTISITMMGLLMSWRFQSGNWIKLKV